jgi:hypothetical protein
MSNIVVSLCIRPVPERSEIQVFTQNGRAASVTGAIPSPRLFPGNFA